MLTSLKRSISVLGRRGDKRDRAITLRELIDSGLAVDLASAPFDPNNPGSDIGNPNDDGTPSGDVEYSLHSQLGLALLAVTQSLNCTGICPPTVDARLLKFGATIVTLLATLF